MANLSYHENVDKKNINKIKFKIAVFYGIVANCYKCIL